MLGSFVTTGFPVRLGKSDLEMDHWGGSQVAMTYPMILARHFIQLVLGEGANPMKQFDLLKFRDKPTLPGMSDDMRITYEFELTLADEATELRRAGSESRPSALTIEPGSVIDAAERRHDASYNIIDIESLQYYHDSLAIQYLRWFKSGAPRTMVGWWNLALAEIDKRTRKIEREKMALLEQHHELIGHCDFAIIAMYFRNTNDTFEDWSERNRHRVARTRYMFEGKPVFVAISPHPFRAGRPWQFVTGELYSRVVQALASQPIDGIVHWSTEGPDMKTWDSSWPWVQALPQSNNT